ncbi:MAG TPA: hypothetical protein EYP41_15735, partial [Anaerolineae bacterium]|nr:hypothetical protein [Anaerolineae bacterium]
MTLRNRFALPANLPGDRLRFLLIFLALFLFFNNRAGTTAASGPDDLSWIAYWQLDEAGGTLYADAVGGRDAQCTNCPTAVTGQSNNGQSFAGSNDGLDVTPDLAFDWTGGDSFSIELWVKADTACAADEVMVGRGSGAAYWSVGCNGSGNVTFQLSDGFTMPVDLVSSGDIRDGLWHHIVATRDSSDDSVVLYVDGSQAASTTQSFTGSFADAAAPVNIGYWNGGAYFGGVLDEVALYNGRLPQRTINNHYYIVRNYINACDTVDIMPLGNSITRGYGSDGGSPDSNETIASYNHGYRNYLYDNLITSGYDFDFIGRLSHGGDSGFIFDLDHNGFAGDRADELKPRLHQTTLWGNSQLPPLLTSAYHPNVILLHVGTNDVAQGQGDDTADIDSILSDIDLFDPNITVILATIVEQSGGLYSDPFVPPTPSVVAPFNSNLDAMINTRLANGDKIIRVDQFGALNYTVMPYDMYDGLHPNETGYQKMAEVWFGTLDGFLPDCAVPAISSSGGTAIFLGDTYTYDVQAAGYPLPAFSLQNAPAGMSIDPATGLISWTP